MWKVKGQDKTVNLLNKIVGNSSFPHAFLLIGPAQVGKTTLAVCLAQALNCEADEPPCLVCGQCSRISRFSHPDVQLLSLISNLTGKERREISIDEIRALQHSASLPPFEAKHKIFIIRKAETMSTEAANCLLKTLEEPPDRVIFILTAETENRLLPTIASRCHRIEVRPMPIAGIRQYLELESGVDHPKADLIARLSQGRIGWAITAARDSEWEEKRLETVSDFFALFEANNSDRLTYASRLISMVERERRSAENLIETWASFFRDLIMAKAGLHDLVVNIDSVEFINKIINALEIDEIISFITLLTSFVSELRQNVNPKLACESLLLEFPTLKRELICQK